MTAEPVQVLVTIHPDDSAAAVNWRTAIMGALLRDGQLTDQADYSCELVRGQPHGEAKAHRDAAAAALDRSVVAERYNEADAAQRNALAAIAHALLALGERP